MSKIILTLLCFAIGTSAQAEGRKTATGIPVDTAWKQAVYDFAQANVVHPAWGLPHSERDYQLTLQVAAKEGIQVDLDVLFAAAFLHDLGGLAGFEQSGVDHAVRSAELVEPLLKSWAFPMDKFPQVKEMILGHTYYGPKPNSAQAKAFRDADVLDFLGVMGIARIMAITEEGSGVKGTIKSSMDVLADFAKNMKGNCLSETCKTMAEPRQVQLDAFLATLKEQSFDGKAL